jgi:hypothetical protein
MKTTHISRVIIISLLIGIVSTLTTYAASPAAVSAKNIRQKFVEAVMTPDEMSNVPSSGEVEVLFRITDDGSVDIKKVQATSEAVSDYVKEKIANVKCQDFLHPYNQYYKVKFRFTQN